MELSTPPKKLNKSFFCTLNKTPLGETGCLSNLYYLLAAQSSTFLIYPISQRGTFGTLSLTVQNLRDLQDAMPCHWSPRTSHLFPPNPS